MIGKILVALLLTSAALVLLDTPALTAGTICLRQTSVDYIYETTGRILQDPASGSIAALNLPGLLGGTSGATVGDFFADPLAGVLKIRLTELDPSDPNFVTFVFFGSTTFPPPPLFTLDCIGCTSSGPFQFHFLQCRSLIIIDP